MQLSNILAVFMTISCVTCKAFGFFLGSSIYLTKGKAEAKKKA